MKTNKIILSTLALGSIATVSAFTFAATGSTDTSTVTGTDNSGYSATFQGNKFLSGNMQRGDRGLGLLGQYIDYSSLTEEQKTAIQTLENTNREQAKTLMDQMKSATTDEEKTSIKTQLDTLQKDFLNSLKSYVSTDKLTDFENAINSGENFFGGPRGGHGDHGMGGNKLGKYIDYSTLTDEQKTAIKTLEDNNRTQVKALMDQMKDATTDEAKASLQTQIKTLQTDYLNSLKTYVSSDKLTEFESMIASGENLFGGPMGEGPHGRGGERRGGDELGRFIDYSSLTDEQKTAINDAKKTYLNSLKQYVSSDKQTEFDNYISNVGNEPQFGSGEMPQPPVDGQFGGPDMNGQTQTGNSANGQ